MNVLSRSLPIAALVCAATIAPSLAGGKTQRGAKSAVARKQREHVQTLLRLASLQEAKGDLQLAIRTLLKAHKLAPEDGSVRSKLLVLYDKTAEPAKKIPIYQATLKSRPRDADAYIGLGTAYYKLGQKEKARASWESALALAPRRETFYRSLAAAYQKFTLYHEAAVTLKRGCELFPKSYPMYYNLAMALEKARRYPEAIAAFEKALTLTTSNTYRSRIDWRLLALYKITGTLDEAIARRREAAERERKELGAMYWRLAEQLEKSGRKDEAQRYRRLAEATGVPKQKPKAKPKRQPQH